MNASLLASVHGIERGWAWLYTAGMPAEYAARRRQEVAADSWEHAAWARSYGLAAGRIVTQALHQFVLGVPQDVGWRVGLGRAGVSRARADELGIAFLLLTGIFLALPLAFLFAFNGGRVEPSDGHADYAYTIYAVAVLAGLCGTGAYMIERHPVAGGVLGALGSICFGVSLWGLWMIPALSAGGVVAAVVVSWRLGRGGAP